VQSFVPIHTKTSRLQKVFEYILDKFQMLEAGGVSIITIGAVTIRA